jgi:hypothetical protein
MTAAAANAMCYHRRERRESGEGVYWGGRDALVVVLLSGRHSGCEREIEREGIAENSMR